MRSYKGRLDGGRAQPIGGFSSVMFENLIIEYSLKIGV